MFPQAYKIWSLAEMLELPIGIFLKTHNHLCAIRQAMVFCIAEKQAFIFVDADYQALPSEIENFCDLCAKIGLSVTRLAAENVKQSLKLGKRIEAGWAFTGQELHKVKSALDTYVGTCGLETQTIKLMSLDDRHATLYDQKTPSYGEDVLYNFSKAAYDIGEADKCLALERSTAAVFHLTRVMEVGLKAVALCLGCPEFGPPDQRSWGQIMTAMRNQRTGKSPKWPENEYFSEVYAFLQSVKDAWRDETIHVQKKHTQEEAFAIRDSVKSFMVKLAARMDENGAPKSIDA